MKIVTSLPAGAEFTRSIADTFAEQDTLAKLMDSVPITHRIILWLFIVEQYRHDEIALLVNKTASYSKSIISIVMHCLTS